MINTLRSFSRLHEFQDGQPQQWAFACYPDNDSVVCPGPASRQS
jgi:hypothetical protein